MCSQLGAPENVCFFFFSSRRRHTRYWRDWSSDVCSSDLVGAGLGICGAVLQSLLLNPLADPFVLGISSGASTGAVVIGVFGLGGSALGLSRGGFVGGVPAVGLVILLGRPSGGGNDPGIPAGGGGAALVSPLTSIGR